MCADDWRAALGDLAAKMGMQPGDSTACDESAVEETADASMQKTHGGIVHVAIERKGRAGKTATILYGFTVSEDELKHLAAELKRALGCGGSVRGDEILIQGDRQADCRRLLADKGYKVK